MISIDRRSLLTAFAATTVCASSGANAYGPDVSNDSLSRCPYSSAGEQKGTRLIARQMMSSNREHSVDFWSKPLCKTRNAEYLSTEITREILLYEDGRHVSFADQQLLPAFAKTIPSPANTCDSGAKNLFDMLLKLVATKRDNPNLSRTALIALDSQPVGPMESNWADFLPVFRSSYDRIIGHIHIEQRGFVHWKNWAGGFNNVYFSMATAHCDAVIMTSPSLIEHDPYLSSRVPTETLVGQLMARLGCALLDKDIVDRISPIANTNGKNGNRKPRVLAMGSAGSHKSCPGVSERDLIRQRELVFSSFGKPMAHPLLIATLIDDNSIQVIHEQLVGTNLEFLTLASCNQPHGAGINKWGGPHDEWSELIALWPFDPDFGPWP